MDDAKCGTPNDTGESAGQLHVVSGPPGSGSDSAEAPSAAAPFPAALPAPDPSIGNREPSDPARAEGTVSSYHLDEPTDEVVAEQSATMADQAGGIQRIEERLDELARLGSRNADHVSALHAENQRLRTGELRSAMLPLVRDVMRVHDDVVRLASSCEVSAAPDLQLVRNLLLEALMRWDITAFEPTIGDAFDPSIHSGVTRVETSEHAANTVAGVRRCGFRDDTGRVIRTAEVSVYVTMITI